MTGLPKTMAKMMAGTALAITLGAGFSQGPASLIVCRFFAGVFASPAISNASATIVSAENSAKASIARAAHWFGVNPPCEWSANT